MSIMQREQVIYVLSDEEILNEETSYGIWHGIKEIRKFIPRRKLPDRIYEAISSYKGLILWLDGEPYSIPSDEIIFGNDPDFRWLDNCYLAIDYHGNRRYQTIRSLERARILDLFLQLDFPMSIARHYK